MPTKYTRKQLKQPDEFISFSMRVAQLAKDHVKQVVVMISVAVALVMVVWAWTYYADTRGRGATASITRAMDIYDQPVVELEDSALKKGEDPDAIPRFKDQGAKLKAATAAFGEASEAGAGDLGDIAILMRAGVNFDRGQYAEAITDYQAFLKKSGDPRLRVLALEGLAYCYEATKALDKALENVRKIPRDGDHKLGALYQEGRILSLQGKKKEASDLFKKVIADGAGSPYADQASSRLALLEAK